MMTATIWTVLAAAALAAAPAPALAYLDPASGSLILQAILGGIAGVAVAGKLFWHRVLAFFGLARDDEDEDDDESR